MLSENMCSEVALQKMLRQFSVPPSVNLLSSLKQCESLEQMQPCVDNILQNFHLQERVVCKLAPVSFDFLKENARPSNPIAIRVTNIVRGQSRLHTINIVNYDHNTDTYTYDEQDIDFPQHNKLYRIRGYDLIQWRYRDYGFYCHFLH